MSARGLAKMRSARDRAITPDPVFVSPQHGVAGTWRGRSRVAPAAATALVVGLVVFALTLVAAAPASGQGRSERLGTVAFDGELRSDGDLDVVERREFVYDGAFRGAWRDWSLDGLEGIEVRGVSDAQGTTYRPGTCSADQVNPGQYQVTESDGTLRVTWCWDPPPTDTSRTIVLDYTLQGAGTRHADASVLDWLMIGTTTEVPTAVVEAELTVPTDDIRFWAHGPLSGVVEPDGADGVTLSADEVPPGQFVDLRVLMPAAALSDAPDDGREVRQDILDEEACLAAQANAARARARGEDPTEDCDPDATIKLALSGALALGLLGGGVGWWRMFTAHGREYPLPPEIAELDYEHDLPSEHPPAHVDYLLHWGDVREEALTATVLDLARRGHLTLERGMTTTSRMLLSDREESVITFTRRSEPERGWERDVMQLLFDHAAYGRDEITDRELKSWVSANRSTAFRWWQSWTSAVAMDTSGSRWIESKAWVGASVAAGLMVATLGVAGGFFGANLIVAGVAVLAGIAMAAASPLMRRRTPDGRVLEHRWRRFGAYLTDYSLIPERGPEYLVLWGHWLVYAVVLDVADTVVRNLETKLSEAELQQVGGGWYPMMWYHGHLYGGLGGGLSSVTEAIPTSAIASSPESSGSGMGGGGFSGGGGGGVGGGGSGSF